MLTSGVEDVVEGRVISPFLAWRFDALDVAEDADTAGWPLGALGVFVGKRRRL
jgi:MYXO-CTERM domain-containing protein